MDRIIVYTSRCTCIDVHNSIRASLVLSDFSGLISKRYLKYIPKFNINTSLFHVKQVLVQMLNFKRGLYILVEPKGVP